MSRTWTAADGREITDEMIDGWCDSYEKGEFPAGERTAGSVHYGRPPLSSGETVVISVKVPVGMKRAIEEKAKAEGVTTSAYARGALTDKLLAEAL